MNDRYKNKYRISSARLKSVENKFEPRSKNLASIVRGFKLSVTTYARKNGMSGFKW